MRNYYQVLLWPFLIFYQQDGFYFDDTEFIVYVNDRPRQVEMFIDGK